MVFLREIIFDISPLFVPRFQFFMSNNSIIPKKKKFKHFVQKDRVKKDRTVCKDTNINSFANYKYNTDYLIRLVLFYISPYLLLVTVRTHCV